MPQLIVHPGTKNSVDQLDSTASTAGDGAVSNPSFSDVTGLTAMWDGKIYSGSGNWLNQVASPADSSAQSAYDLTPSNVGLYSGSNSWLMNGSANFALGSNTTFVKSMSKTTAGTGWTFLIHLDTPSVVTVNGIIATAQTDGSRGFIVRADSTGALKLDFYEGTTHVTKAATTKLVGSTTYNLAIKYDYDNNQIGFSVNSGSWEIITSTFTNGITGDPTYTFKLGSQGNGSSFMANNVRVYGAVLYNRPTSNSELVTIATAMTNAFTPAVVAVPSAPSAIAVQPGDTVVNLAWKNASTGGGLISDHKVEYKLHSEPTTWTTFSHSASAVPMSTVTGLTNSSLYDFRVSTTNSAGYSPVSSTYSATPLAEGTNPYDESNEKISLCVGTTGIRLKAVDNPAAEILQPAMLTYQSGYFGRVNDTFVFNCPDGGATTSTATFCRVEFRNLTNQPFTTSGEDTLKFAVTSIPNGDKVIVHQIHDMNDPWVKMTYTGKDDGTGQLRALVKASHGAADTTYTLLTGITNGDQIVCRIVYDGSSSLAFYIGGVLKATAPISYTTPLTWTTGTHYASDETAIGDYIVSGGNYYRCAKNNSGAASTVAPTGTSASTIVTADGYNWLYCYWYWKRGNYFQDASGLGNICTVVHYTQSGHFVS